ncbi:MAG: HlyD family efflux transporter periplasmic adaptor subunit [Planctomycetia bacterium]|nr:HlyD family efflux transporter periplasmic adaptor subunit [Planctomycetia bacterium]
MSTVEERAVEEARRQILAIVDQIRALAQGDMQEAEFFSALLAKAIEAMGATAGVVWLVRDQGRVEPVSRLGLESTGLSAGQESQAAHGRLVSALLGSPAGLVVPPRAALPGPDGSPTAENPTDLVVIAAPIDRRGTRVGLIEVFHQPNAPDVERGYLKFLEQTSEPASLYLDRRQLATLDSQQATLVQVDRFSRAVHETLDPIATAFVLANEARRIIGCDRVSVLVKRGRKLRLEAVSGQESIERRASAVQALQGLVRVVAKAGDPLWHPDPSRELPPQIEEELEAYVDESHATALAIIPLEKPRPTPVVKPGGVDAVAVAKAEAAPRRAPQPIGALVAEWFSSGSFDGGRRARVELVAEHGKVALANALAHTGLPFYRVLELLGTSRVLTSARNLPKTLLATLAAGAAVAALVLVPADLRLEGKGTLEPVHRRDVFARIDGVVESIAPGVEHGAGVKEGQLLATLRNLELDVALTDVLGRKAASEEQLVSTRRALLEDQKISPDEKVRMAGRAAQLQREIESLEEQRRLYETKKLDLAVQSPIDGVIVTWQVRDRLMLRPVEKGQVLLNVADKTGPWELEIHLPDDRLGHVNRAAAEARAAGRDLEVDYILATDPGRRHAGTVREIHEQAEVRGEQGNTVLVRVTIDPGRHEKEELGAGASVTARINCGTRPLGYVIFHDLVAFVQTHVLFRLW